MNGEILQELRRITRLLVLMVTKEQPQVYSIEALDKIGFQPKEIAGFLGTTSNTVRVALAKIRKKNKLAKGKKEKKPD